MKISRRKFIKSTSIALLASSNLPSILASQKSPTIITKNDVTLRVMGTHVTLQEAIRTKAEKDLGIRIEFSPGGSAEVLHNASTKPESFDIYEQWSNSINVLWRANAIQSIDCTRLEYWSEINDLSKKGRISAGSPLGQGDAPYKILFVQPNGQLGSNETGKISFMPYVYNADSYGYNASVIPEQKPYETESWSHLLDESHRGKVAIVNAPTIGLFDLALSVQANGWMEFKDIGSLTRAELDELFNILIDFKRRGHFRGFWQSVPHSVQMMSSGETHIQSMFSPGVSTLRGMGIPCIYAAPKEGYRAWHGVMCLSSACDGAREEAAYRFMNWWLSGWAGAFIARQGYYISNPERAQNYMSEWEWDYWYAGKPASKNLTGTDGKISVQRGESRRGGSYQNRFSNIAVWNTVMPTYDYSLLKWKEFLLA